MMAGGAPRKHGQLRTRLELIGIFGPAGLLIVAAFVIAYQFVQPAPPRHIVMATGSKSGAYYQYGRAYRDLMTQEGIEVTLVETAGSVANIGLLSSGEADIAFVQGGTRDGDGETSLRSLASLYFEPVWLFMRKDVPVARLTDLLGRRVAIDREGSGTRAVALRLLADNGLDSATVEVSPLGGSDAASALRSGSLDAAFFVISAKSQVVQDLFAARDIRLFSFNRAEAYRRRHRFLSHLTLPEGAIDLAADLPPSTTMLLAPAANLVVREDFHPALAELLLTEARKIHGRAGLFEDDGEFPSRKYLEYPIADAAERYFDSGPSLLQRYLPFWAANLIDRLKIMLLPLIALVYPLFRIVPPTYEWRMRSRIDRWYKKLQAVERDFETAATHDDLLRSLAELEALEQRVRHLTMVHSYGNHLYSLRLLISVLHDKMHDAVNRSTKSGT